MGAAAVISRPLLIPLLGVVIGLTLAGLYAATFPPWGMAALLGLSLAALFTPNTFLFPLLLFLSSLAWGVASLQPEITPEITPATVAWYSSETERTVEGVIDERPERSESGCRVTLRAEWLADAHARGAVPVTGRLLVYIREGRTPWVTGDRVRLVSKLRRPRNYGLPGEYDFVRQLALKGLFVTAGCRQAGDLILIRQRALFPLRHRIDRLALRLGDFISQAVPGEEGGILRALLLGDRGDVPPAMDAAYARAGVNHILSISGFHVAVVALVVYQLLSLLGRCSEQLMLRCNLRRLALGAGLPVIIFYLVLSGAAPATARSVIMIALAAVALLANRETDPVNILITAALLLLGCKAPLLFDLSFQLSFLAIWGLIVLTPLLLRPFQRWEKSRWVRLLQLPAASVAAIAATLVPVAYYFHRTTAIGVVANLFIVPLMGYGAVVVGFSALPFAFIAPVIGRFLLEFAGFLVFLSDRIILSLAQAPLLPHWTPTRMDLLLSYLLLLSLTLSAGRWGRGVAALLLLLMIAGHLPWGAAGVRGMEVTFFSLGQAESTLVRFPAGETLLVDGGGSLREGGADTGERLLAPALWALGVERLDLVALTHTHPDHLRGLRFIVENFPVGQFWESGLHEESDDYRELRASLARRGVPVLRIDGSTLPLLLGGGRIEPLAPFAGGGDGGDTNDDSLVFRLVWRNLTLLFTGDIGEETEALLLTHPQRLRSVILKVPHHGSRYSSSPSFLDAVHPRVALISAGYGNSFHLPAPQTLERLRRRRSALYRTDLDGTITLRSFGEGVTVSTFTDFPQEQVRGSNTSQ